jgi:predicted enzyme related to lactoylglutathione lyase
MSVQVYGCNHVAIEVNDVEKAVAFYQDLFNLQKLDEVKATHSSNLASISSSPSSTSRR